MKSIMTKAMLLVVAVCAAVVTMAEARTITVTAGGDAFMVQGFPKGFSLDAKLTGWIASGDVRLVNFETVVNDGTCRPAAWSGGTWSSMDPSVLPDFFAFGFNGCGCANNHSLDFSQDALFMTMKTFREKGMPFAGIGENLQEATKAAFVDTPNGKVAFLSISAAFHPDAMAGWKTSRSPGRSPPRSTAPTSKGSRERCRSRSGTSCTPSRAARTARSPERAARSSC